MPTRELDFTYPVAAVSDKMKEYNRKYREAHDYQVTCACGATFKAISIYTHQSSRKHREYIKKKHEEASSLPRQ
jgi:hypothetical protein